MFRGVWEDAAGLAGGDAGVAAGDEFAPEGVLGAAAWPSSASPDGTASLTAAGFPPASGALESVGSAFISVALRTFSEKVPEDAPVAPEVDAGGG